VAKKNDGSGADIHNAFCERRPAFVVGKECRHHAGYQDDAQYNQEVKLYIDAVANKEKVNKTRRKSEYIGKPYSLHLLYFDVRGYAYIG
jgi:hypothetical protein